MVPALVLLCALAAFAQTAPPDWKVMRDGKGLCRVAVPPEWTPMETSAGAAVLSDPTTAIAVVTSQPGQAFKPLNESLQRLLAVRKEKMFENSPRRVFYQDKISRNADDSNAYSASVPAKSGTCSCRIVFLPKISEDVARKIALSLGPAEE